MDTATVNAYQEHAAEFARRYAEAEVTALHQLLLRCLVPGSRVLEIGCGSGRDAAFLAANGHAAQRLPNTSNITFHGIDAEALLLLLDQAGVCASSGSACLADSDEPSHVIKAMKPDTGTSRQTSRFSLGLETTDADVQTALRAMTAATSALRASASS